MLDIEHMQYFNALKLLITKYVSRRVILYSASAALILLGVLVQGQELHGPFRLN